MPLSSTQRADVRTWVSDVVPPTDDDLDEIHGRRGTLKLVVWEVLRKRLATLQAGPAQFAVAGDYSQTTAANITSLEKLLKELDGVDDDLVPIPGYGDETVTPAEQVIVSPLQRHGRPRRRALGYNNSSGTDVPSF